MKKIFAFFAATRYWEDLPELTTVFQEAAGEVSQMADTCILIKNGDLSAIPSVQKEDCLVVIPMSGAVQKAVLETASQFTSVCLYASYVVGNFGEKISEEMLKKNAAPTLMDCWAVLKRTHDNAVLALDNMELDHALHVFEAYSYVHNAKILLIGETEPWVISNSPDLAQYEKKLGIQVEQIDYHKLEQFYQEAEDAEVEPFVRHFKDHASGIVEPTEEDIYHASRFAAALLKVLDQYHAQGAALACFHLIEILKINSCLGVSYINDCTDKFAACEGDIDSAVTMLLMKKLSADKLWMANPNIQSDRTINFTHCTAPLTVCGKKCRYSLRNHHESNLGVSPQVEFPVNETVTMCRVSDHASAMTIQKGTSVTGNYEASCRTQMKVQLDDFQKYLDTVLGCHQVLTFGDITSRLTMLGRMLKLTIL